MRSILIADDNPHAQRMGSQILGQAGHQVFTLSNGERVHSFVAEHHPDVAILDLRMPGVSGIDLCRKIKADGRLESTKVLLLAGPLDRVNSSEVENAGSDGIIQKPLDAHTLITTIDGLFSGAANGAADAFSRPPARPISLVDPPHPPSRAFTGNGAPGRLVAAATTAPKANGHPAAAAAVIGDSKPLPVSAAVPQAVESRPAPPPPQRPAAPPNLEIASEAIIEDLSDVLLGELAPPRARPRENGSAAPPLRTNRSNGQTGKSLDPFAALVEHALGTAGHDAEFEARVAQIVDEAVRGAMHGIRDRITHEVISTYRRITV